MSMKASPNAPPQFELIDPRRRNSMRRCNTFYGAIPSQYYILFMFCRRYIREHTKEPVLKVNNVIIERCQSTCD